MEQKYQSDPNFPNFPREQGEAGRDDAARQLHARYQRGELTFRAVAGELRLSVRELYELFEQKGLPT